MVRFGLIVALTLVCASASAQEITVRAQPDEIEVGRTFTYVVDVNVTGDETISVSRLPDFGSFEVVARHQMPRFMSFNGAVQRGLATQIRLRAKSKGTFKLPGPTIRIGKKKHRGNEVTVRVLAAGSTPKPKKTVTESDRYFLETIRTPKREPYVGEQISLTYNLFTEGFGLDVSPRPPDEPELNEFWIEDLSQTQSGMAKRAQRNGRLFRQTAIRKYALFPLKTGAVTIEPMEIDLNVGSMFRSRTIRVASDPIKLNVQPLPANAPDSFYEGNVGQWKIRAISKIPHTKVGQAIQLDVTVEGYGHVGRVRVPAPDPIEGVDIAQVADESNRSNSSGKIKGSRTLTFTLTPTREGTFTIPEIGFSFFDPAEETYKSVKTKPIEIRVAAGKLREKKQTTEQNKNDRGSGDDLIRGLTAQLTASDSDVPVRRRPVSPPFLIWWLLSIFALVGIVYPSARNRFEKRRQAREVDRQNDPTYELTEALDGGEDAATLIKLLAKHVLAIRLGSLSKESLEDALEKQGASSESIEVITSCYDAIESAKYDPTATSSNIDLPSLRRAITSVISVLIALFLIQPTAHGETTERSVSELQAAVNEEDVASWFRFGNAAAHQENYGAARWALEQARLRAPFYDLAHNDLEAVSQIVRIQSIEASRTGQTLEGDEQLFWWRFFTSVPGWFFGVTMTLFWWLLFGVVFVLRKEKTASAKRDALVVGAVLFLVCALTTSSMNVVRGQVVDRVRPVVVVAKSLELREGPSERARRVRTPRNVVPGVVVRVDETRERWVRIQFAHGLAGWANPDQLKFIE